MKTDARVRYTRRVLRESIIKLLKIKRIEDVTVKELCEVAEINRATFYAHYENQYDLLKQIEDELFDELSNEVILKFERGTNPVNEIMRLAFDIVGKNQELCRVLFAVNGYNSFLRRVMRLARDTSFSSWKRAYPGASKYQMEYLFSFVVSGSVAVIEQWLDSGMKETPLGLADVVNRTTEAWLGPARPAKASRG